MVNGLEAWLRRWVMCSSEDRGSVGGSAEEPTETLLVGAVDVVNRLLVVRPNTVAVLTADGAVPQLKRPGDLLVPPVLSPGAPTVTARAVSTATVDLDVTVTDLVTFDGHPVDRAVLRVGLQLDDPDGYAALLDLAADHGDDLEEFLLAAVHRELTAAVHGAVRMNRLADLQRRTLATVLQDRWLPDRVGAGTFRVRQVRVQRVRWPGEDEPTVPVAVPKPPLPVPTGPDQPLLAGSG